LASERRLIANNPTAFLRKKGIADDHSLLARGARSGWWWRTVADRIDFFRRCDRIFNLEKGPQGLAVRNNRGPRPAHQ
jgi:hypothetical protein